MTTPDGRARRISFVEAAAIVMAANLVVALPCLTLLVVLDLLPIPAAAIFGIMLLVLSAPSAVVVFWPAARGPDPQRGLMISQVMFSRPVRIYGVVMGAILGVQVGGVVGGLAGAIGMFFVARRLGPRFGAFVWRKVIEARPLAAGLNPPG
ncbi:MAG: hypothetical protein WD906_01495 [Anaerolineales bacterium]